MILGIPTLNRYDLLDKLIASAEAGTVKPSRYIIIDNGGRLGETNFNLDNERLLVVSPGKNLGVAASWNQILQLAGGEQVVISNDDIELEPDALEKFERAAAEGHEFIGACGGWALFSQSAAVTARIGLYDENFGMAYYEDCDYLLRLRAAGIPVHDLGYIGAHVGNASTHGGTGETQAAVAHSRERNYAYFVAKWGADSPRWGNPHVKNFDEPFNGLPPFGWSNTSNMRDVIAPMRWDVLNYIAKKIGAKRYLEIGVADGSCMRRIQVEEKWGIDPTPQPGAVSASTIFVPRTSDLFFETLAGRSGLFDLVFIDGDHRAEQVYREVHAAMKILSPKGVICLHDCNPHSEEMQQVPLVSGWQWTGDVWKAIARLRSEGQYRVSVVASDYGIGIALPARGSDWAPITLPCDWDRLLWRDLVRDRPNLLGLIAPGMWQNHLNGQLE